MNSKELCIIVTIRGKDLDYTAAGTDRISRKQHFASERAGNMIQYNDYCFLEENDRDIKTEQTQEQA